MPTNIVQIEDAENGKTILRVEGEMPSDIRQPTRKALHHRQ
jgi:hypothetical protein